MNVLPSCCLALVLSGAGLPVLAQQHVCGGIGVGEQQRMKSQAADHDLMLTFATSSGAYLADVGVQIRDSHGKRVVDATCDGPIMLVDLPGPGTYRITARSDGVSRERSVSTGRGKRPASAIFVWPASSS